nr:NAD-binding protein [Oscillospiraceae bacterium]
MKIIIVGLGKVGYAIAQQLEGEHHDLTLVDASADALSRAENSIDAMFVTGNGAGVGTLIQAGVRDADLIIAVTENDEVNLICCLMAKKLGARRTIARVRNPEYFREAAVLRREIGLDYTINPEYAAAQEIARILRVPAAFSVESLSRGLVELIGFQLTEGGAMAGVSLTDYNRRHPGSVLICAAKRGDEVIVPNGSFVPQAGDLLYAIGSPSETTRVLKNTGREVSPVRRISILGGGRVALYLAWALEGTGAQLTIVER